MENNSINGKLGPGEPALNSGHADFSQKQIMAHLRPVLLGGGGAGQ